VFELFDLAHDAALVAAQSAGANADQLASAGALDRRAWQWPLHRPLIAAALDAHLPVRASNIARADLMRVARAGATALPIAPWRERFQNAHWGSDEEAALRSDIVEAHCNALPAAAVPGLLLAQRVRDAVMAQALVDAATADGAILVAGNGHVRKDLGVPVYLEASHNRDTTVASVSVGFVEVSDTERRAADFPHNAVPSPRSFDYVWFTSPASRDDPCAALRPSTH